LLEGGMQSTIDPSLIQYTATPLSTYLSTFNSESVTVPGIGIFSNYFDCVTLSQIYKCPPPPPNTKSVVGVISLGGGLYGNVDSNGILTNSDCQTYWTWQGIATSNQPTVVIVPLYGASNNPTLTPDSGTGENTLDVETIGSWYPSSNLTIIVYIAPNSYVYSAVNYAINNTVNVNGSNVIPSVLSISWGNNESPANSSFENYMNTLYSNAVTKGINICVATGDNEATGYGSSVATTNALGSSAWCIACGGTSLICPSNVYNGSTVETVWNNSNIGQEGGTGGGISAYMSKPAYQSNITQSATQRCIPDISLNSDPYTGLVYIVNGSYQLYGGTSTAAPAIAAFIALTGITYFLNTKLYKVNSNCFHDITVGNNKPLAYPTIGYNAQVGYDLCTGFGSIIGTTLSTAINTYIPSSNIGFKNILSNYGYFSNINIPFYSTLSNTKWYDTANNVTIPPAPPNVPFSFFQNKMCRF